MKLYVHSCPNHEVSAFATLIQSQKKSTPAIYSENETEYNQLLDNFKYQSLSGDLKELPSKVSNTIWCDNIYMLLWGSLISKLLDAGWTGDIHVIVHHIDDEAIKQLDDFVKFKDIHITSDMSSQFHYSQPIDVPEMRKRIKHVPGRQVIVTNTPIISDVEKWHDLSLTETKDKCSDFNGKANICVQTNRLAPRYLKDVVAIYFVLPVESWLVDSWLSTIYPSCLGTYVYFCDESGEDTSYDKYVEEMTRRLETMNKYEFGILDSFVGTRTVNSSSPTSR